MGPGSKQALDACMVSYYGTRSNILNVTRQIRGLSRSGAYQDSVGLLKSIPGIGALTAMTILTELETMERFGPLDRLCGFIGLVPSTNDPGDNDKAGDIAPRGHSVLRGAIIESAWVAARVGPALAKCYHEYCRRMDGNKAIIRIAKKLVGRIRYVLKNKKKYVCGAVK
jgi:transposase